VADFEELDMPFEDTSDEEEGSSSAVVSVQVEEVVDRRWW